MEPSKSWIPLSFRSSALLLLSCLGVSPGGEGPGDSHTVALWLFDDHAYPNTTLTDAGPHRLDLRLICGYTKWWRRTEGKGEPDEEPLHVKREGGIVPGKFGSALRLPAGEAGSVEWPPNVQRYGTDYLNPRPGNVSERLNLGYLDWTLETWFKAEGEQPQEGMLFELRNERHRRAVPMVNTLRIDRGRARFLLSSKTLRENAEERFDVEVPVATDFSLINDGSWHHLAFTCTAEDRQIRHYVDGKLQTLPGKGGFLPMMGQLVSFRVGDDLRASLDEMRLSDTVRYTADFQPPGSLSRAYGPDRPAENRPDGPAHLFSGGGKRSGPVRIGSRKHVFVDDVMIERMTNLSLTVNPPLRHEVTGFRNDRPWEPTPRMGSTIPDVCSVWDEGDEIRMLYTNSGMWGGKPHAVCLATSKDGLNWEKPILNLEEWDGSTDNNIVLRDACQGSVIKDPNPEVRSSERYKYAAWGMYRGFYVYTSPDGIHWRRNENCALPFDPDGSISFFWDDQRGIYRGYIRSLFESGDRRRTSRVDIPDLLTPWPFRAANRPDLGDMDLARPIRGELPLIDTGGQVYRFKGHKYEWAPDTYLAFPWRFVADTNIRPGSFLMVSRDGETWRRYENPYYLAAGWKLGGRAVLEALMENGMVRRGDEIWMFGTVRFTEHGGVLYGGVEHEGGVHDRLLKLVQRLDGFVSVDAGPKPGSLTTKRLIFEGDRLELNVSVRGTARLALLDESEQPYAGFSLADCDPIHADSVRRVVTWKGNPALGRLAGKIVRLKLELQDAKLYSLQFRTDRRQAAN